MSKEQLLICALCMVCVLLASCDGRSTRSDAGPADASSGAPPGSPCGSDFDCLDGVCRESAVTQVSSCYARCPSDRLGHLCDDGSECYGYCRGDQGPNALGTACDSTESCLPGLECADGICTRICDEDHLDICEPGTTCMLFPAGWGFCRAP
ncbi:MAG: hypothetical protein K8H88_21380 [Sandaracinaceae bacterium]|nr:hypothetical protein [Sandaracinaceae bacterium]